MIRTLTGLALLAVLTFGCSDDDDVTPPLNESYRIVGTVVDPGDMPLTRAFVNIDYTLLQDGGRRPRTTVSYEIADSEAMIRIEILDPAGRLVRVLVNDSQPGGSHSIIWNGLDDDGNLVPEGPYTSRIFVDGELSATANLFLEIASLADRATTFVTLTDETGRFTLDIDDLGVGLVFDSAPGEEVVTTVHTTINLFAFRGGSIVHDVVTLDLSNVEDDLEVELVIPYGRTSEGTQP